MRVAVVPTPGLVELLRTRNDNGTCALRVLLSRDSVLVLRADGSELSETEAAHVRAVLAAHKVQPL